MPCTGNPQSGIPGGHDPPSRWDARVREQLLCPALDGESGPALHCTATVLI